MITVGLLRMLRPAASQAGRDFRKARRKYGCQLPENRLVYRGCTEKQISSSRYPLQNFFANAYKVAHFPFLPDDYPQEWNRCLLPTPIACGVDLMSPSMRVFLLSLAIFGVLESPLVLADPGDSLGLRVTTIDAGNRLSSFGNDPERFRQTGVYKAAQVCGASIAPPDNPFVVCTFKNRRMFYLFYNVVTRVPALQNQSDEPYLIQTVKRTITDYPPNGKPISRVSYLVEAIKTRQGVSKKPDQHFGNFGIYKFERRKIVKEFVVGTGSIQGIATSGKWPFDPGILYKSIQSYQADPGHYEKCCFTNTKKWTLVVEFDRYGNHSMKSDELGIEIMFRVPEAENSSRKTLPAGL